MTHEKVLEIVNEVAHEQHVKLLKSFQKWLETAKEKHIGAVQPELLIAQYCVTERNKYRCSDVAEINFKPKRKPYPNEVTIPHCVKCKTELAQGNRYRWYHGDQDDLLCLDCAGKTKHTDTIYAGQLVVQRGF